jgi:hypothetical protein
MGPLSSSSHKASFLIVWGQQILKMILKRLFTNVRSVFLSMSFTAHVSHPYKRTDLTTVLKSLNFVLKIYVSLNGVQLHEHSFRFSYSEFYIFQSSSFFIIGISKVRKDSTLWFWPCTRRGVKDFGLIRIILVFNTLIFNPALSGTWSNQAEGQLCSI